MKEHIKHYYQVMQIRSNNFALAFMKRFETKEEALLYIDNAIKPDLLGSVSYTIIETWSN